MQKLSKFPLLARLDDPFLALSLAIRQFHKWRTSLTTILLRPKFQIVRLWTRYLPIITGPQPVIENEGIG